jgi:transmembrane sensor
MNTEKFLLDDTFLAWFFQSDLTEWERWESRRKADPDLAVQMDEAGKVIEAILAGNVDVSVSQQAIAHTKLKSRIQQWEQSRTQVNRSQPAARRFLWSTVAASVSLIAVMAYWLSSSNVEKSYVGGSAGSQRVELPDGSLVNLNAGASLRTRFEKGKDREVWLEGEGYFVVSKQEAGTKFIVHTEGLDVEVFGTQFNVKGGIAKTEVVLEEGSVQVSRPEDNSTRILMEPGEMAEFNRVSGEVTKRDVKTRMYTSWKEGKVVFENAGVEEISKVLLDRYGMKVEAEDGVKLGEFNGIFPSDDPKIVLTALEKTYPRRIVVVEGGIVIKKE